MTARQLFIIDSQVQDYQTIINNVPVGSEWFVLAGNRDGIQQLQEVAASHTNLDSIHIISHGAPGLMFLGSSVLTEANLALYRTEWESIGKALNKDGRLFLYGCEIAASYSGRLLVQRLDDLVNVETFASTDVSGINGNACFEYSSRCVNNFIMKYTGENVLKGYGFNLVDNVSNDAGSYFRVSDHHTQDHPATNAVYHGGSGSDFFSGAINLLPDFNNPDHQSGWYFNDVIKSHYGDEFYGGDGDDGAGGGLGDDRLFGEDGDDGLSDSSDNGLFVDPWYAENLLGIGNDYLSGGAGNDFLQSRGGNDSLYGDDGDDYIYVDIPLNRLNGAFESSSQIFGGDGNDVIYVQNGRDHDIDAGFGNDLVALLNSYGSSNVMLGGGMTCFKVWRLILVFILLMLETVMIR